MTNVFSGDATCNLGCFLEHPDLKKKKIQIFLYLLCIRNILNHKIKNTLKFYIYIYICSTFKQKKK